MRRKGEEEEEKSVGEMPSIHPSTEKVKKERRKERERVRRADDRAFFSKEEKRRDESKIFLNNSRC